MQLGVYVGSQSAEMERGMTQRVKQACGRARLPVTGVFVFLLGEELVGCPAELVLLQLQKLCNKLLRRNTLIFQPEACSVKVAQTALRCTCTTRRSVQEPSVHHLPWEEPVAFEQSWCTKGSGSGVDLGGFPESRLPDGLVRPDGQAQPSMHAASP